MRTLAGAARFEESIKRSRFVAHAARTRTQAESLAFFESVADPQATHNCWAWRIDLRHRCNDEGEPSGTAGRPILAAIEGRDLDQVMIVVTRYYGGIKLGVGGLVRAYGGCASKCLDRATVIELHPQADCRLTAGFAHAADIHRLLEQYRAEKLSEHYDGEGLQLTLRVEARRLVEFRAALAELTQGQAGLEKL
jgi:uncharacterized YigZ family protein